MLHSLHFDTPCLTNICGWPMANELDVPGFLFIAKPVDLFCVVSRWLVDAFEEVDILNVSSALWRSYNGFGVCKLRLGSDSRAAKSDGINWRSIADCVVWFDEWIEFGDAASIPRGLCELLFGDGVSGGLPGSDGAHTICSGVTELLSMERFSLPSIIMSMLRRPCSPDKHDENDMDRSLWLCGNISDDNRRTDRSNGIVSSLWSK